MSIRLKQVNNFGVTVGNTSTQILAANPLRKHATLINSSNEAIWLGLGEAAVSGQGVYLEPSGGAYEIDVTNLFIGAIFGICASGGKDCVGVELS